MSSNHESERLSGTLPNRTDPTFSNVGSSADHGTRVESGRKKRLQRAKIETAEVIDELIDERWARKDDASLAYTNVAIAERLCDVDEATVRKWRTGDKPMPIAAVLCMPLDFSEDLAEKLLSARRELAGDRRSIVALGRAVERCNQFAIHGVMSQSDRTAYRKALRNFIEQLGEIAESLEEP